VLKAKVLIDIALMNKSFHSYGVSLATWDHTVLLSTQHKWMCPALSPARQPGTRLTYPRWKAKLA